MKRFPLPFLVVVVHLFASGCKANDDISSNQQALEVGLDRVAVLRNQGEPEAALAESIRIEADYGADPLLYVQRSSLLESMRRIDEAEREGLKAIAIWPGGYPYMSRFYARHGRYRETNQMIEQGLKDPRVIASPKLQAVLHYIRAKRLVDEQAFDAALQECELALDLTPDLQLTLKKELSVLRDGILKTLSGPGGSPYKSGIDIEN